MSLERAVNSRVASWLGPWLREQRGAEIKLGFRRCLGTVTDLEFDTSKLDPLIDVSTRLVFSKARVAQLSLQFDPWSWPNLLVIVTGFHVSFVPRVSNEENRRQVKCSPDNATVDSIDPEGAILREVIENALKETSSGSWMKNLLTETLIKRCQIQFIDTSFQVQLTEESEPCLLRSAKISLQPQFRSENRARKRNSKFLSTSKKESLSLSCNAESLEFGLKGNGFVKILLSLKDPLVSLHFQKLSLVRLDFRFPSIFTSLSPEDISLFLLLTILFSKRPEIKRGGKMLWKIAARRVSVLTKSSRVSWHKLIDTVMLWLSYVQAYEVLLSLVGYPVENTLKNHLSRLCHDSEFSKRVQLHFNYLDELEKKLPVEAARRARSIARKRMQLSLQNNLSQMAHSNATFGERILSLINFCWKFIYCILCSMAAGMLFMLKLSPSGFSSNSFAYFSLTLGDFCFQLHPIEAAHGTSDQKTDINREIPVSSMPSFSLIVKSFFFFQVRDGFEKNLGLMIGDICIQFSPSLNISLTDIEMERVYTDECGSGFRTILSSEPANLLSYAVSLSDNKQRKIDAPHVVRETSFRKMNFLRTIFNEEFEGYEIEQPFFMFELGKRYICPNSARILYSDLRCITTMGKLNIILDNEPIILFMGLLGQIQDSLGWIPDNGNLNPDNSEKPEEDFQLCISQLETSLLKLMPLKNIQAGIFLSGCNIKIPFLGSTDLNRRGWSSFSTELSDIEFSVWPASVTKLLELCPDLEIPVPSEDLFLVRELRLLDIAERDPGNNLSVRGRVSHNTRMCLTFSASFEDFEDILEFPVIGPFSININGSKSRQYLHSFYQNENSCSLSIHWMIGKTEIFLNMDELRALFQVLEGMTSAWSRITVELDCSDGSYSQEYIRRLLFIKSEAMRAQKTIQSECEKFPLQSVNYTVDACLELGLFNVNCGKSRKSMSAMNRTDATSSSNSSPGANWYTYIGSSLIKFSCDKRNLKLLMRFSDIHSDLYPAEHDFNTPNDDLMRNYFVQQSLLLSRFCLPHITLTLSAGCDQDSCSLSYISIWPSVLHFQAEIEIGKMILGSQSLKSPLVDHQCSGLHVLISRTVALHDITFESQGGYFLIEMDKLVLLTQTAREYFLFLSRLQLWTSDSLRKPTRRDEISTPRSQERRKTVYSAVSSELFRIIELKVSDCYVVFADVNPSGKARYLIIESSLHFGFSGVEEKSVFDLLKLIVFSKHIPDNEQSFDSQAAYILESDARNCPNTRSLTSNIEREISLDEGSCISIPLYSESYILDVASISLVVEKTIMKESSSSEYFSANWVGNCSVSGFQITISLSEILMIMDLVAPLSGLPSVNPGKISKRDSGLQNQSFTNQTKLDIPDGAIVVMKDFHQHQYIAIEDIMGVRRVGGALHYSLVGDRALFRVDWKKGKQSLFYLRSLDAKDLNGEPLQLNFSPGSGFVEVSEKGRGYALWKIIPYEDESYEDVDDREFDKKATSSKKSFYLINYKNDAGVSFVEGGLEFVKRPGSVFKLKILPKNSPEYYVRERHIHEQDDANVLGQCLGVSLLDMRIKIDKVSVTVCHEISSADDKFPLACGFLNNVHIIGQMLPSKFRIMSTFFFGVDFFDAQMNSWRQMILPVNSAIFVHSRRQIKDSKDSLARTPTHYHFKISQVAISLTELVLDVLLFICERLGITDSYMLRKSIFCNFFKVENLSSLNLLCHVDDERDIVVGGKKATSVLLRRAQTIDQFGGVRASVSVRAFKYGGFSTLPLDISLVEYQTFAWRTSILSQEGISSPGPYLGLKVSMQTEDGSSLSFFPLWRIDNMTGFPLELRLCSPEKEPVIIYRLGIGVSLDDFSLLDGSCFLGDSDTAMLSLSEGNLLLSLKPATFDFQNMGEEVSADWTENMMKGNATSLSGVFDQFSQRVKDALGVPSVKSSLTTVSSPLVSKGLCFSHMHFLIQITERALPVIESSGIGNSALLPQKEIFISPTFQVFNLLETEISVVLSETYPDASVKDRGGFGRHAVMSPGSNMLFYANPASMYFTVSLTVLNCECKPVDTSEYVKKLRKQKFQAHFFDIGLDFNRGKQYAHLRLSCGERGTLEATIFSSFTLKNSTELSLFCFSLSQNSLALGKNGRLPLIFPPEHGVFLLPNTTNSWLLKSKRVYFRLNARNATESYLDLDNLSGFTELKLESTNDAGISQIIIVGISLKALDSKDFLPAQLVTIAPRYVISNASMTPICFRQFDLENDGYGITRVETNSVETLYMHPSAKKITPTIFESLFRMNMPIKEDSLVFIQFGLDDNGFAWSGPICVSSLGHFFIKFRKENTSSSSKSDATTTKSSTVQFASVNIVEEISTLVLYFHLPPALPLPYRIENFLSESSITFFQKDTGDPENLRVGGSVDYVWDDQNKPHKLVVQISGIHILREINIDKISPWKPLFKSRQNKLLSLHFPANRASRLLNKDYNLSNGLELRRFGYEVYIDGLTRVLRICELAESSKEETALQPHLSFRFRMSSFSINFIGDGRQEQEERLYEAIIALRFTNLELYSSSTDEATHISTYIESINVDNKWHGAPFASMIRRSQLQDSMFNKDMLRFICILHSSSPKFKEIKCLSLLIQPFDLNLDEETLMRLASFWRTSVSDSKAQSQLYYFKQFEIHPLKISASFLPGNPYSSYSSAQETLRSLLHTVIKVPSVKNTVIKLNGILLNHALLNKKELIIKCAQHYSWYVIRAVYVAKGTPLLPPAIASVFDDTASSVLDVFFDPSSGSIDLPGFTLGMFKFVNKYVNSKELSGTKRYLGDLSLAVKKAGSSILFAAITEISDSILRGAETDGFSGLINGFHQGILRLAMEPAVIGGAVMLGGPDRKLILDQSPGSDEMYIEGYLQAMLHVTYNQEYLQVKVIDNVVQLKNLPPNTALIDEITDNVKSFLVSQGLLNGESTASLRPLRHLRREKEWSVGSMMMTLGEHLFVSFTIRLLRAQADKFLAGLSDKKMDSQVSNSGGQYSRRIWVVGKFVLSGVFAYVDGWLCRRIPNPIVRRIVSGFLLTFLVKKENR